MTGFFTRTPAGHIVHMRGNRKTDESTLAKIEYMFDLAIKQVEREDTYQASLKLVARIDEELRQGTRHYWRQDGVLLRTLDEVVRAYLDNDLLVTADRPLELAA